MWCWEGVTTLGITTFNILALSIKGKYVTLSITTLRIMVVLLC
jgi:hypothetical protein